MYSEFLYGLIIIIPSVIAYAFFHAVLLEGSECLIGSKRYLIITDKIYKSVIANGNLYKFEKPPKLFLLPLFE